MHGYEVTLTVDNYELFTQQVYHIMKDNASRDTSPIIGQRKWLCHAYLNKICGLGQKQ